MQNTIITTKQYVSLAAVMLLAPLVPLAVKTNEIELMEEDNAFINSYIRYGNYILIVLAIAGIIRGFHTFILKSTIMSYISQGLSILGIAMIFLGVFGIMRNVMLIQDKKLNIQGLKNLFTRKA